MDELFGKTYSVLEHSLDVRMMRQNMIASNLANLETPGYRAVDVDFETTMQNIVKKLDEAEAAKESAKKTAEAGAVSSHGVHIAGPNITVDDIVIVTDDASLIGENGNTVSMEKEIGKLQENRVMYNITTQLLGRQFQGLNDAIRGGSR